MGSIEVTLNKGTAPCCGKYIMVGRIKVCLMKWFTPYDTIVKGSSSPPLLAGRSLSADPRSMSNPKPSSGTTIHSENPNLRIVQTNVDNYGSIGSSSASSTLYPAERLPAQNIRSPDKSSTPRNFGKKRKFAYAKRSNSTIVPFDICLPGRQNLNSNVSLHANKECYTEMEEGLKEDRILRPGMVLLKHYITDDKQVLLFLPYFTLHYTHYSLLLWDFVIYVFTPFKENRQISISICPARRIHVKYTFEMSKLYLFLSFFLFFGESGN